MPELSIVVPLYNAASFLTDSAGRLRQICERIGQDYEILFGDDGSRDETPRLARQLAAGAPRVHYFRSFTNRGLGYTLRRLFEESEGKIIVYCDCDLPFGEAVIEELVSALDHNDIVLASRYSGQAQHRVPLSRRICSRSYYGLCRLLFGVRVRDIGSGTVAFRREILERIQLTADGFDIHAELYAKARRCSFRVKEIPAAHHDMGEGSFRILKHAPGILAGTFQLWRELKQ